MPLYPAGGGLTSVATANIENSAVTYAKIQNVSATDKLLGRSTSGAGVVEEIACTTAGRALIDDADAPAQRATLGAAATVAADVRPGVPPSSPDSFDEEFATAHGMTAWNPGSNTTLTQSTALASLRVAASAGSGAAYKVGGAVKALPASDHLFIVAEIELDGNAVLGATSYPGGGLALLVDPVGSPTTCDFECLVLTTNGVTNVPVLRRIRFADYQNVSGADFADSPIPFSGGWVGAMVEVSTGKVTWYANARGHGWTQLFAEVTMSGSPTHAGPIVLGITAAADGIRAMHLRCPQKAASALYGTAPLPLGRAP
jgi:hypothetical protein